MPHGKSVSRGVGLQRSRDRRFGVLLTLPAIAVVLGILLYPLLYSFSISFTDYRLLQETTSFVGLSNYTDLFRDESFRHALQVTGLVTFFSLLVEIVLGLLVALTLVSIGKGRQLFRTLFLMPMMLSPVVVGLMFRYMFNDEFGIVNTWLKKLGLIDSNVPWLLETKYALASIIILDIWATTPLVIILLYAGLLEIPKDIYEAGRIDGAGAWKAFLHLTFPLLKPILLVTLIIRGMDVFRVFDSIYVLTGGGPANSTESLALFIYRVNWQSNQVGLASAGSFIMLGIMIVVSLLLIRVLAGGRRA